MENTISPKSKLRGGKESVALLAKPRYPANWPSNTIVALNACKISKNWSLQTMREIENYEQEQEQEQITYNGIAIPIKPVSVRVGVGPFSVTGPKLKEDIYII